MVGWGVADILIKLSVERIGVAKTVFFTQIISLLPVSIYATFFMGWPLISRQVLLLAVLMGFFNVLSCLAFFKGLQVGKVSLISPIGAAWGALLAILGVVLLKEQLTSLQSVGITLTVVGVILASTNLKMSAGRGERLIAGVEYALLALFGWAATFLLMKFIVEDLGPIITLLLLRLTGALFVVPFFKSKSAPRRFSWRHMTLLLVALALLDSVAYIAYNFGVSGGYVSIVGPIAASYPAITVILARIFFKERTVLNQGFGIASILAGLILISL